MTDRTAGKSPALGDWTRYCELFTGGLTATAQAARTGDWGTTLESATGATRHIVILLAVAALLLAGCDMAPLSEAAGDHGVVNGDADEATADEAERLTPADDDANREGRTDLTGDGLNATPSADKQAGPSTSSHSAACNAPGRRVTTTTVDSKHELVTAIKSADPGDVIALRPGVTIEGNIDLRGVRGTPSEPIVLVGDPSGSSVIDGRNEDGIGIRIFGSEWLEVQNITIRNTRYTGIGIGYAHKDGGQPARNIVIDHVTISDVGQEALHVNDDSSHIAVTCSTIRNTGRVNGRYGEGIYIGQGSDLTDEPHDVKIAGNVISSTTAEAVDIKARSYNIDVLNNYIYDINVKSQGAVTVAHNDAYFRNGNYRIERNVIHSVTSRQYDGAAVWVGHGDALVANNVIWDIADAEAIITSQDFANQEANNVQILFNTVWKVPEGPLGRNAGNAGGGGRNPASHDVRFNVVPSGVGGGGNYIADDSDFADPSSRDMNAGDGPGSGLRLASSSAGADSATLLPVVSTDITGNVRDARTDPGAFDSP